MSPGRMRWWTTTISLATVALATAACEPPPAEPPPKPAARRRAEPAAESAAAAPSASAATPVATEPPAAPAAALPGESPAPIRTRKTIGKTTFAVLDLAEAVAQGGVKVDDAGSSGGGGLLGAAAQAYRHSVSTIGGLQVEQKLKLYQTEHGSLPATHEEFMARIIAPGTADEIRLPTLPYYQEYAFDPETRGLVVVEFPAKKEQRERETTGAAGL